MEKITGKLADASSYVLSLEDGRLKMEVSNKDYEFCLEDLLEFTWGNNAYGNHAIPLNILVSSVMGRTLYPACLNISRWLSDKTMEQLLKIKFKKERRGEDYFLIREW